MRTHLFTRRSLIVAALVVGLATFASPARALPPTTEPPDPPDLADLKVSALAVTPVGSSWSITYTVVNSGLISAAGSTIRFTGNGIPVTDRAVSSIAAGATRSGSFQLPRSADCFLQLRGTADATSVVRESSETNNYRQALSVIPPCPARYKVSVSSFKAVNESGADWTGSDEAYWIFNTVSNGGTASSKASQVYGSIDSGDVQSFSLVDSCLWGCGGTGAEAPFGLGFSIQLWEQDQGHVSQTLHDTADAFQAAGPILTFAGVPAWVGATVSAIGTAMDYILGWAEDDLMGNNTYAFSADFLAATLTSAGTSFTDVRTYSGGGATYTLTMVVSRIV